MRMSDVMSGLGLAVYPTVALVIFLGVFVAVVLHVTSGRRRTELDDAAFLPLTDDTGPSGSREGNAMGARDSKTAVMEVHQ